MTVEPQPAPLEIATGQAIGHDGSVGPLPIAARGTTLRRALEDLALEALARPPCGVSFSGGRDSSAVLAIATHVARREGLPLPVPITLVFPDDPASREDDYQRLVVEHLGLPGWQRIVLHDELDLVGPVAGPLLRRHGVTVPFNVYFHQPMLEIVHGGSMLTGFGGDELFSPGIFQGANLVLTGRRRPGLRHLPLIALSVAPRAVRRVGMRRWLRDSLEPPPWLRPEAARAAVAAWVEEYAATQLSFCRSVRDEIWPERARVLAVSALDRLAADEAVRCRSPFVDPTVLAAAAAEQGFHEFPSRRAAMESLAGDLLPPQLPARSTKASFPAAFYAGHARAFAHEWDGTGLPGPLAELVDVPALTALWREHDADSDASSFALMQAAWLATAGAQDSASTSTS